MFKKTRLLKNLALKIFKANNNKVIRGNSNKANKIITNLSNKSKNDKFRNLIYMPNIRAIKKLTFLTFNVKKVFNYLKQVFIKTSIF